MPTNKGPSQSGGPLFVYAPKRARLFAVCLVGGGYDAIPVQTILVCLATVEAGKGVAYVDV